MAKLNLLVPPVVVQDPAEHGSDLHRDLAALMGDNGLPSSSAVQTRPSVLRRVAALLAERTGPAVDRLIGLDRDTALVTAVALHTGLPCALTDDTQTIRGELHPSELVTIIGFDVDCVKQVAEALTTHSIRVHRVLSLFAGASSGARRDDVSVVFDFAFRQPRESQ